MPTKQAAVAVTSHGLSVRGAECVACRQPYGNDARVDRVIKRFGLDWVFLPRGRPYKESQNNGS